MTDAPEDTGPSNPTAEAMKRALAAKKAGNSGATTSGGFKPAQHEEKRVARQNAAANKPAFRKASKRG
jgi:hypothetical protein